MKTLKTFGLALFALFVQFSSLNAQSFKTNNTDENFLVKYVGTEAQYLLFEVEILGNDKDKSILRISDKIEGELYSLNLRSRVNYHTFKIEKQDGQQLIFNLQVGEKVYTKIFYTTTSIIEKTTVQENGFVVL